MELIIIWTQVLLNIFVIVEIHALLVLPVMVMSIYSLIRNGAFKARSGGHVDDEIGALV